MEITWSYQAGSLYLSLCASITADEYVGAVEMRLHSFPNTVEDDKKGGGGRRLLVHDSWTPYPTTYTKADATET